MKKILTMVLAAAMILSLAACSNDKKPTTPAKPSQEATSKPTQEATTAPTTEATTEAPTDEEKQDGEMGAQIVEIFMAETEKGTAVEKILEMISEKIELGNMIETISEGYLPGFSADVTGFKNGTVLAPMISSLPFICYIFEAEDTEAFLATLKDLADPRWNICTEAQAPISAVSGNYVLFTMIPKPEDL